MGDDKQPEAPADESKIPPLNPEDPLLGLTDEQIKESLSVFGKNEMTECCVDDCLCSSQLGGPPR
eukprot:scaffold1538_cov95-Skeletonema_dohrnii-CCMP3373.AAC.8